MDIKRVNPVRFGAGNVYLKSVNAEKIKSYNAIKNIARDKDIDILITKSNVSDPNNLRDIYLVVATKDNSINIDKALESETVYKLGSDYTILNKNTRSQELAVKIYNSTMKAIDVLEKNLGIKK